MQRIVVQPEPPTPGAPLSPGLFRRGRAENSGRLGCCGDRLPVPVVVRQRGREACHGAAGPPGSSRLPEFEHGPRRVHPQPIVLRPAAGERQRAFVVHGLERCQQQPHRGENELVRGKRELRKVHASELLEYERVLAQHGRERAADDAARNGVLQPGPPFGQPAHLLVPQQLLFDGGKRSKLAAEQFNVEQANEQNWYPGIEETE